ncbi:MAG: SWIM zinc finger family protein [Nocardiaceae bacterium]|nr:SWIM zinc finger family protein [Nocardiaceae bacterium]
MTSWQQYGPRRSVRGGVEAKSRSGKFGRTWWGRTLIDTVERLAEKGRMSRGRSYARTGQVIDFQVSAGEVVAEVQGSQNDPFIARFLVRTLEDDEIAALASTVRESPGMLAEIVSGSLPEELGSALLPDSGSDMDFDCSCPDMGYPCKHVAAAIYLLAEHLDSNPVAMLTLRGVDIDALIAGVENAVAATDDPYGDRIVLPALPTPSYAPAPADLDPALLRRALRVVSTDERAVAAGAEELRLLYARLQ